ncbi:hypothetical protein JCM10212_001833 [Sporobolomyces blumeae]
MRQKRVKSYRKVMQLYCASFGFREPYQLLVDAAFLQACVQQKLDFFPRLQDVLQGAVKPMITQCCIQALYDAGPEGQDAVDVAKGFERRKCNHFKVRPQDECMMAMAGDSNKNRYVIATQSSDLRSNLRKVPGTPIVYIARSVVLLESPSDQTMNKKKAMETAKLHAPAAELALLSGKPLPPPPTSDDERADEKGSGGEHEGGEGEPPAKKKKKQRGPKGPNPLSVPKKKKVPPGEGGKKPLNEVQSRKKREREELEEGQRERKRKREENERVVVASMGARRPVGRGGGGASGGSENKAESTGGEGGVEGKKKRKRRKKNKGGEAQAGEGQGGGDDE